MPGSVRLRLGAIAFFGSVALAAGQTTVEDSHNLLGGLRTELQQLQAALTDMRAELADARRDSQELRRDLKALREQLAAPGKPAAPAATAPGDAGTAALELASKVERRVSTIAEEQQVNDAKLTEQDQTKVASGSRY